MDHWQSDWSVDQVLIKVINVVANFRKVLLTDDRHVGVLHEGEVAGRDGDLAQVRAREVDLNVLDHHASLVGRRDLQGMLHI